MSLLRSLSDGLRALFRKEQVSQELDEELNGFLEMAVEEKMKLGMGRKDALRAVRLEQGTLQVTKEVVRSSGWESFVETCWQDLRFAARTLRSSWNSRALEEKHLAIRSLRPSGTAMECFQEFCCFLRGVWPPVLILMALILVKFMCHRSPAIILRCLVFRR